MQLYKTTFNNANSRDHRHINNSSIELKLCNGDVTHKTTEVTNIHCHRRQKVQWKNDE